MRRRRTFIGLTLLAIILAPLLVWLAQSVINLPSSLYAMATSTKAPPAATAPSPAISTPQKEFLRSLTAVIRPGSNVYSLLVQSGLAPADVHRLIEGFAEASDLTKCRPGETFTIKQRTDGSVASITYRKSPLEIYSAERKLDAWRVTKETVPYTARIERVSGKIERSLFQAVERAGEKDSLALSLIDILAWEVDFAHESQPGDAFSLLVEKYYVDHQAVGYGPILAAEYVTPARRFRGFSLKTDAGGMEYYTEEGLSMRKSLLKSPLHFNRITSGYTSRRIHPITRTVQPHYAIDYAAPAGTPVWSVGDGVVDSMTQNGATGRMISISHPGGYQSHYLHLSRYAKGMNLGMRVSQQQIIGFVGTTGLATGPHLDYRLSRHGSFINPLKENFPRSEPVPVQRGQEFSERVAWLSPLLVGQTPQVLSLR